MINTPALRFIQVFLLAIIMIAVMPNPARCGYYIKKSVVLKPYGNNGTDSVLKHQKHFSALHAREEKRSRKKDGYKGILAILFGGSSAFMTLEVLTTASFVSLVVPAFLTGLAAMIFGALKKNKNKRLGHIGLFLGLISAIVISVLVIALAMAVFFHV